LDFVESKEMREEREGLLEMSKSLALGESSLPEGRV
jgi:hypothetical protein